MKVILIETPEVQYCSGSSAQEGPMAKLISTVRIHITKFFPRKLCLKRKEKAEEESEC